MAKHSGPVTLFLYGILERAEQTMDRKVYSSLLPTLKRKVYSTLIPTLGPDTRGTLKR